MKIFKTVLMFFVHHFIRPIWIIPIGLVYGAIYWFKIISNENNRKQYNDNKNTYNEVKSIAEFITWWNTKYKYKYDGYKGLLDHCNTPVEFFLNFGDCDDAALYPYLKFKKLGYKSYMIGLLGAKIDSWHYDCITKIRENEYILFNQGYCIYGGSIKECLDKLSSKWSIFKTYIYWRCFW